MELEESGNISSSRSACYALMALAGVFLLLAAAHGASPAPRRLFPVEFFHLPQLQQAFELLRNDLHNTWLFLWAFSGLWAIVAIWGVIERRRLGIQFGSSAKRWFWAISGSVAVAAILYGVLTNGPLSKQVPAEVPLADIAALVFALSLPALTAQRIQTEAEMVREASELEPHSRPQSFLGLEPAGDAVFAVSLAEIPPIEPSPAVDPLQGEQVRRFEIPAPDAATVDAMTRLIETAEQAVPVHPATAHTDALPQTSVASASGSFRAYLQLLNESWGGIERSGQEIEAWFDQQKMRALSRLEAPPSARTSAAAPPSADFLEERLEKVDVEWERLRQTVLELARWFEQGPRLGA